MDNKHSLDTVTATTAVIPAVTIIANVTPKIVAINTATYLHCYHHGYHHGYVPSLLTSKLHR